MRAVRFHTFGGPGVLAIEDDVSEPPAGPGQVRVRVQAASVNPVDWKIRSGMLKKAVPTTLPSIPGSDAAGIVDQIGAGVTGIELGAAVFGLAARPGTLAEFAVLRAWAPIPSAWTFEQAAAAGLAADTAIIALDALGELNGGTLLIEDAAGGIGSAAVELAVARGASVIGTASERKHSFLRSLGATPTTYGQGLAERTAALAPGGVDAAIDMIGSGSLRTLVNIVGDPASVVSIADDNAAALGATYIRGGGESHASLAAAANLGQQGSYTPRVETIYALEQAAAAHAHSQNGHTTGKIVIRVVGAAPATAQAIGVPSPGSKR